jgi:phosphocarrier protein
MSSPEPDKVLRCKLTIVNSRGLHARASAKLVKCADSFNAAVTVTRDGQSAPGTSIMGLMMLAAGEGSTILVEASGPEAENAIAAISDLVASGFGERD